MSGSINRRFLVVIAAICSTIWVGGCFSPVSPPKVERSPTSSPATPSPSIPVTPTPLTGETRSPASSPVTPSPLIPVTPTPITPGSPLSLELYWLEDSGTKLELVPSPVKVAAGAPNSVLQALFTTLLTGSNKSNLATAIPQGTKLRSLEVKEDGVHVNLSREFTSGGGSASMSGRLGQIVYTATALDPNAPVWINVEGKKLEVLGGEGLEIEQPLTRQKFREDFDF